MKSETPDNQDSDHPTSADDGHSPTPGAPSLFEVDQSNRFDKTEIKEPSNRPFVVPKIIDNYRLLNRVGEGGAGTVFRAESTLDGSVAAVKILKPEFLSKAMAIQRFEKEARMQSQINNPYVTRLLSFGSENGLHYIISEFVDGVSLRKLCRPLSLSDKKYSLIIIRDVLRALTAMHDVGVVHRDVKPENVMVTFDGKFDPAAPDFERFRMAKLTDFGLARHIEQSESLAMTHQQAILGTPMYLAPEQYTESRAVDARADVYSLGATLFHLLAGEPPFDAETFMDLADLHRVERPRPLNLVVENIDDALSNVVAKALEKQPDLRYSNAGEMLTDIENVLAGRPISIPVFPEIPAVTSKVRKYNFAFEFDVPPSILWPLISDTDRFNRAMGLPAPQYSYRENDAQARTIWAEVKFNGMSLRWLENPFQWIEGRELSVLREFSTGPFAWMTSTIELFPMLRNRTRLVHSIQVEPRGWVGKLMTPIQFGWLTPNTLTKVYGKIAELATESENGMVCDLPFGKPVSLSRAQRKNLDEKVKCVSEAGTQPQLAEKLGQYLATAADASVSRIRPRLLARSLDCQSDESLDLCLTATDQGLLSLMWDLICPVCRIASDTMDSIRNIGNHGHCSACNTDFKIDFAKSVELIFRVHPEIRKTDTRTYCIGGPFHSPHVIAQSRIKSQDMLTIGTRLDEGSYQIRGPQLPATQTFRVKPNAISTGCHFELLKIVPKPELLIGEVAIELTNRTEQPLLTRVERSLEREEATTAADVSRLASFQEMFPSEVVSVDQLVNVTHANVLLIRIFEMEQLIDTVGEIRVHNIRKSLLDFLTERATEISVDGSGEPESIKVIGERVIDVLATVESCRQWRSRQKDEASRLKFGFVINSGEALISGSRENEVFGKVVRITQSLIQQVKPQQLLISKQLVDAIDFQNFSEKHWSGGPSPKTLTLSDGSDFASFELPTEQQ